jgi:Domain of unknown function (DUF5982)/Omp85 superfamily domain
MCRALHWAARAGVCLGVLCTALPASAADETPPVVPPLETAAPPPTAPDSSATPPPETAAPGETPLAAVPPPPPGFDAKRPLTAEDYQRKVEGGYFTGLPLLNFDPNTGVGFGARVYYFYNADRGDPLFAYTPYLQRVFLQAFFTTGGMQFHWLDYDAPAIGGSAYRIRSQAIYLRNTSQHFFGLGNQAMDDLTYTGATQSFDSWDDYDRELRTVRPDGTALSRYDHYELIHPVWLISVERTFFNGLVRPLFGFGFSHTRINDYTGRSTDAIDASGNDVTAVMGPTRLSEECAAGLVGCDGGWDNYLRFGLSFDTRDFEPDPNTGIFADIALDLGTPVLGSEYSYARWLTSVRGFWSPIPQWADLVLAARGTFQVQSDGTPFFSLNLLPYTEDSRTGLGGHRTLRGFQQDRFVGNVVSLLNFELRWTFYHFSLLQQKFAMMLVPFLDMGRVYDSLGDFTLSGFRHGQGAGYRMSWNQATVIVVDYGFSSEDSGLYINFNHQF